MRAVLMYHSLDDSGSPISLAPATFAAHVRWLASGRVRVLPLEALVRAGDDMGDAVALTFDDAFANFAAHGAPLLAEHDLPVTMFAVSGHAGGTNAWGGREPATIPTLPLLDWNALGRLADAGVTLGAHTRTHPALDRIPDAALADEIEGGADEIETRTGRRPTTFAYPYGATSEKAAAVVRRRFAVGVTTRLRAVRAGDDMALVPRLDAHYFQAPGRLESWGTRRFDAYVRLRDAARTARARLAGVGR